MPNMALWKGEKASDINVFAGSTRYLIRAAECHSLTIIGFIA